MQKLCHYVQQLMHAYIYMYGFKTNLQKRYTVSTNYEIQNAVSVLALSVTLMEDNRKC